MIDAQAVWFAADANPYSMSIQVRIDLQELAKHAELMRGYGTFIGTVPAEYVIDAVKDVYLGRMTIPDGKVWLLRLLTALELKELDETKQLVWRAMRWRLALYWD